MSQTSHLTFLVKPRFQPEGIWTLTSTPARWQLSVCAARWHLQSEPSADKRNKPLKSGEVQQFAEPFILFCSKRRTITLHNRHALAMNSSWAPNVSRHSAKRRHNSAVRWDQFCSAFSLFHAFSQTSHVEICSVFLAERTKIASLAFTF